MLAFLYTSSLREGSTMENPLLRRSCTRFFALLDRRYGAQGVWVGTRFICAREAGAPKCHQQAIIELTYDETIRTLIFTGRPLRVRKNPYIMNWETERREEMRSLLDKGLI